MDENFKEGDSVELSEYAKKRLGKDLDIESNIITAHLKAINDNSDIVFTVSEIPSNMKDNYSEDFIRVTSNDKVKIFITEGEEAQERTVDVIAHKSYFKKKNNGGSRKKRKSSKQRKSKKHKKRKSRKHKSRRRQRKNI